VSHRIISLPVAEACALVLGRSPAVCAVLTRAPMPALDPRPVALPRTRRPKRAAVPAIVWSVIAMLAFFLLVAASSAPGPSSASHATVADGP